MKPSYRPKVRNGGIAVLNPECIIKPKMNVVECNLFKWNNIRSPQNDKSKQRELNSMSQSRPGKCYRKNLFKLSVHSNVLS